MPVLSVNLPAILPAVLLLACGSGDDSGARAADGGASDGGATDGGASDSGVDSGDDSGTADDTRVPPLVAEWTAAEVEARLLDAAAAGFADPATVRALFLDRIADRAGDCFGVDLVPGTSLSAAWQGDCEDADGVHFEGGWLYAEELVGVDIWTVSLLSSFVVTEPDGLTWTGGGTLSLSRSSSDGGLTETEANLGGTYRLDGGDGWQDAGVGAGLDLLAIDLPEGPVLAVNGGHSLADETILYFQDIVWAAADCPDGIAGIVRLRDPSTGWWSLDFGALCSPCATLSWQDEEHGELCVGEALVPAMDATAQALLTAEPAVFRGGS